MKGKLVCLIGLTIGGIIGAIFTGKKLQKLQQNQNAIDARLTELHQQEMELFKELEANHQRIDEEIQKTQELISQIKELGGIDPTEINVQIDPE